MGENHEGKFNVGVGAVIEGPDGRILMMKRHGSADFFPGMWECVTGRVKQFESPEEGLKREIKEETGLDVKIIKLLKAFHFFRGEKKADNELIGIVYWCKTAESDVRLSKEHSEFRWTTPEEALSIANVTGVRGDIERFIEERDRD